MFIYLFRGAGATGHVFFLSSGRTIDKGLAYSGFAGPKTTIAVVPTTSQILDFAVETRTKDKQNVTVSGNLKVTLSPEKAVSQFDFTVSPKDGSHLSPWEQTLHAIVIERVLAPIHEKARTLDVEAATQAHSEFEKAITAAVTDPTSPLAGKGIIVESCSIAKIDADDDQVAEAIGSKERQSMLAESDRAVHNRRLNAAENERAVRTYEAETALKLEEERSNLIEKQGENEKKKAEADAEATKLRMASYSQIPAGEILGASLMEMAKSGRIGNLSIVPELLAALDRK